MVSPGTRSGALLTRPVMRWEVSPSGVSVLWPLRKINLTQLQTFFATLPASCDTYFHFMVQPTGVVSAVGGSLPASTASRASLK
jgi:hypothetical protein